MMHAIVRAVA